MLNRHEYLSREEFCRLWIRDGVDGGNPLPERTFFNYRRAIEKIFHIDIRCDKAGRYYIDRETSDNSRSLSNWLLDSYAVNEALKSSENASNWVEVEDVPSARGPLPIVLDALKDSRVVSFTYSSFNRSRPEPGIAFHPYFLKRYKQRWYMTGLKEKKSEIRTYALDRVSNLKISERTFTRPKDLDADEMFGNIIGVTTSKAKVHTVRIRTTPMQAKYFRALPLHRTQQEELADGYSIFTYRLKLNYELVHELMGLGSAVTVLDPPELRAMVRIALKETLDNYKQ